MGRVHGECDPAQRSSRFFCSLLLLHFGSLLLRIFSRNSCLQPQQQQQLPRLVTEEK